MILTLYAAPVVHIYRGAPPEDDREERHERLRRAGSIFQPTSVTGGAENASINVELDNADGALSHLFTTPPLLKRAVLHENGETLFDGTLTRIRYGARVSLSLES